MPGLPASIGTSPLDGPPPSPTPMGGGSSGPFSPLGLVPGAATTPTDQMPPEILTGLMQSAQTISATLDSFAQVTPDKAPQLNLIKELLARYLADVTTAGAGPISPTAPGPQFPGGGIDRGISSPGSV